MKNKQIDIILTIIVSGLWTFFIPYLYYFSFGMVVFIDFFVFLVISLPLTIWWLIRLIKQLIKRQKYSYYILSISIFLTIFNLIFSKNLIERLDWKYYYSKRMEIVEKIKIGELVSEKGKIKLDCFPPISNGGNEISVYEDNLGKITLTFYINRGFLDHYSAFIYTERPVDIEYYEKQVNEDYENHTNKKMGNNWYRVSY